MGTVAAPVQLFWDKHTKKKAVKASGCAHPWIGSRGRQTWQQPTKKLDALAGRGILPLKPCISKNNTEPTL